MIIKDKKVGRPRKYKKRVNVTIAIEENVHKNLQKQVLRLSAAESVSLSMNEIITRALLTCYPLSGQMMFEFDT